jgi:hypothetical protein
MKPFALVVLLAAVMLPNAWSARRNQRDPINHETAIRQARPRAIGEIFDPKETDLRLRDIFVKTDLLAERAVRNIPRDKRFIFRFWLIKKQMLKRKHGIDWKTPAELNPNITYGSYGQPALMAQEVCEIAAMIDREVRSKGEKIVSIERTFDGTIDVWTTLGNTADRGKYGVAKVGGKWKIVDRQVP